MPESRYEKLSRKTVPLMMGRSSLWLGDDHLLSVKNRAYNEEYKRFYYRDIQAIILRKTITGVIITFLFVLMLLALIVLFGNGWNKGWESGFMIFGGIMIGFFFVLLLVHMLRGPTCSVQIRTAVQTEKLLSLDRMPQALKAIRKLRTRIESVQGTIGNDQLSRLPNAAAPAIFQAPPVAAEKLTNESGSIHAATFVLLLCDAFLSLFTIFYRNKGTYLLNACLFTSILICVVVSLIRQRNSDLSGELKKMAWSIFGYLWVSAFLAYIYSLYAGISRSFAPRTQWEIIDVMIDQSPLQSTPLLALHVFSIVCSLGFGVAGLLIYFQFRKKSLASLR